MTFPRNFATQPPSELIPGEVAVPPPLELSPKEAVDLPPLKSSSAVAAVQPPSESSSTEVTPDAARRRSRRSPSQPLSPSGRPPTE